MKEKVIVPSESSNIVVLKGIFSSQYKQFQ